MKQTEHRAHASFRIPNTRGTQEQTKHWAHAIMTMTRSLSAWPQNIRFMKQTEHRAHVRTRMPKTWETLQQTNTEPMKIWRVNTEHTLLWIKPNAKPMRVRVCPKHEGRSKQTKHWNHGNVTMPVLSNSLLARCKFATSSVYDNQTSSGRLVAEMRAETNKLLSTWKHDYDSFLMLVTSPSSVSVLPDEFPKRCLLCKLNDFKCARRRYT